MTQHDAAPALRGVAGIEALAQPLPAGLRVWRVDLDVYARSGTLAGLSPDERARASRLVHEDDARRFQAARHALRRILGACIDRDPATLAFISGEFGKPKLADDDTIEFNLSHSVADCLVAVSRDRAVGIDVERVSLVRDIDALSRRHFTAREREALALSAPEAVQRTFLAGWTRKEACVKALGVGLSLAPSRIDAGCDKLPRDVDVDVCGEHCRIALASLVLGEAAVGSVALVSAQEAASARRRLG